MKKLLIATLLTCSLFVVGQVPTKLFAVKNGNGAVDGGNTYPDATIIIFKNAQAKSATIDAFAQAYGYQANVPAPNNPGQTVPNPVSKQQFFNQQIQKYLSEVVLSAKINVDVEAARKKASDNLKADLPDNDK